MKSLTGRILAIIIGCVLLFMNMFLGVAAQGVPQGFSSDPAVGDIVEENPIQINPNGNMFANMPRLLPGSTAVEYALIINTSYTEGPLYMEATLPDLDVFDNDPQKQAESEKVLAALDLEIRAQVMGQIDPEDITKSMGTVVYKGKLDGSVSNLRATRHSGKVWLGHIYPDCNTVLKITVHAPDWMDNSYENLVGKIYWTFYYDGKPYVPPREPDYEGEDKVDKNNPFFKEGRVENLPTTTLTSGPEIIILGDKNPEENLPSTGGEREVDKTLGVLLFIVVGAIGFILIGRVNRQQKKD